MKVPDRLALWRGGLLLFLVLVCLLFYWLHRSLSAMTAR